MLSTLSLQDNLSKITCYKCGAPLDKSNLAPLTQASVALVAHVVCPKCHAQSIVTLTPAGIGTVPLLTDLTAMELKHFMTRGMISYSEILELHKALKRKNIWKLLHSQELYLAKKQKSLDKTVKSRQ